jgi:hypothetical protein
MLLKMLNREHAAPLRARDAAINPEGRFENVVREAFDDGWDHEDSDAATKTRVTVEYAKSIITRNDSPHPVRPANQSVPRLRDGLHLLLCAAAAILQTAP